MQIKLFKYDFSTLKSQGIRYIMLDVDNTLLHDHAVQADEAARNLIQSLKAYGFTIYLVSNGKEKRISLLAQSLEVGYLAMAQKPLTHKIEAFIEKESILKENLVLIGDQWFTDMLCAQRLGIQGLWAERRSSKERWFIAVKRPIEYLYLKIIKIKNGGYIK